MATPRVLGTDDFSLRRPRTYATILIDAETRRRIDVLPDRRSDTLAAWLRQRPGVQVVCRDGAASYADAVHQALPDALQRPVAYLAQLRPAVGKEVAVHSGCWASASRVRRLDGGKTTTLARWQQVHDLLDAGVGLLECAHCKPSLSFLRFHGHLIWLTLINQGRKCPVPPPHPPEFRCRAVELARTGVVRPAALAVRRLSDHRAHQRSRLHRQG
ncbi:transposase [Actinomadura sp. K4S16]|uniref:transposase n=1 Tax=Actinomadura sp. K4S16 TaxID=1316147 RepID=UPI001357A5F2